MSKSKVYFTDLRTRSGLNLTRKLENLCRAAGFASVDFKDRFTALKIHFGEPGNLAYLRPNYAAVVAGLVRECGGKLELHSSSKPKIERDKCVGCGLCVKNCAHAAVSLDPERRAVIDYTACVGCGQCIAVCRYDAAKPVWDNASALACKKIAEYAWAALKDKSAFHLNFVVNVSPDCDCWDSNDQAIVPDVGMLASLDPVALDQASADAVDKAAGLPGSRLADKGWREGAGDKFSHLHPDTDWRVGLEHAEKIGLGRREYELVVV